MTYIEQTTHSLARKGTPNLYLAANFLEPDDKFRAFLAAYAAMRVVDDITDNFRSSEKRSAKEKRLILSHLDDFADMFTNGKFDDSFPYVQELKLALGRFNIPRQPFIRLAGSMKFDLENDRFDSFPMFLKYCEGAAVAPAAVFMHLAGSSFDDRGQLQQPAFDIYGLARPLAIFSYMTHILRDFKKDFQAGTNPLIYFDSDTLNTFHIRDNDLAKIVTSRRQSPKFTKMIKWYYHKLSGYKSEARKNLNTITARLPNDGLFALNFIYFLYSASIEIISKNGYNLVNGNLDLAPEDIYRAALSAVEISGQSADLILGRLRALLNPKSNLTPERTSISAIQ